MRSGGYTFQQSLTHESASIVRQAMSLARRRGHSHVTPLHVASAMLASSTGLLRRACLHSHSHPLQCKALELCFNVALNRLPTSSSNPILGPHSHLPSLSNALVAAFKRAQAHQRRGSIENQQQPILALKVEVEQLVISILDDPSVSRVMREAGFSSSQVKINVEQAVSFEIKEGTTPKPLVLGVPPHHQHQVSRFPPSSDRTVRDEDVMSVVEAMMSKKRRNTVVVGECLATAEGVVKGVIEKMSKGEVEREDMRHVQFISVPVLTLRNMSREEFELKIGELRALVKSYISRGVVLYLGDLKWVSDFWSKYADQSTHYCYSPVEHMIMELSRLLCGGIGENGRLWLMGISSFQTYIKCKTGHPSLENLWSLHPLTIPVGSFSLSLKPESDLLGQLGSKTAVVEGSSWSLSNRNQGADEKHLTCCVDCMSNFNKDVRNSRCAVKTEPNTTTSLLPSWLQKCKDDSTRQTTNHQQEYDGTTDLCTKWNSICSTIHKHPLFPEKNLMSFSPSPCSSPSISSSNDKKSSKLHQSLLQWPVIFESNRSPKEHLFFASQNGAQAGTTKPDLLSNPNSSPNSASSSEASGDHLIPMECLNKFNEVNSENMDILCKALEKRVPWQNNSVFPEVVGTVLKCRSGLVKRKGKQETWMFFLGVDSLGKERVAKELARVVFGSEDNFIPIGISSFSPSLKVVSAEAAEEEVISNNKRGRDEEAGSYLERFLEAVRQNPSRVFFMEDIDQVDYHSQKGIKKLIESGSFKLPHGDGETVRMKDAIVIFSCESFEAATTSRAPSPVTPPMAAPKCEMFQERKPCVSLDLNLASEDGHSDEHFRSNLGILEVVDKQVEFKIHDLLG
ncbi:unnamed protein product [Cuscuta epithymum]|uniref:Clp R domain-containing protein n=1 Tax=Cuscuta epithymum TaxID=186058 RepID=A0AAV0GHH9_9ASTE|nr:unnamed protein product [Cuscuta epithymum]